MIGRTIGNYVIRQKLGEGGMGEVYLAEHPQIGKKVALKVLRARLAADEEVVTRFFHEAKAVNEIGHANIVDILDYGVLATEQGDVVYLIMELLAGVTLTNVLEQVGVVPLDRAVRIASQIADALAASHARGIVHRDLKPDNIMLVNQGRERDFVKLLDFGIAKLTRQQGVTQTRTGTVLGTPIYMSPEQCEGRADIDHRTDIYALGVVMYEMLAGRAPFLGSSFGEIAVQHLMQVPARPPPPLDDVVMKALEKRPEDRHASMADFIAALGDRSAPPPPRDPVFTTLRSSSGQIVSPKIMRLRTRTLVAALAAAAVVIAGALIVTSSGEREHPARSSAPSTSEVSIAVPDAPPRAAATPPVDAGIESSAVANAIDAGPHDAGSGAPPKPHRPSAHRPIGVGDNTLNPFEHSAKGSP